MANVMNNVNNDAATMELRELQDQYLENEAKAVETPVRPTTMPDEYNAMGEALGGYVWSLMWEKFPTCWRYFEDMYHAAIVELLAHRDRYDPAKGTLTTFAKPYILHGLEGWVNKNVMFTTPYYATLETRLNNALRAGYFTQEGGSHTYLDFCIEYEVPEKALKKILEMKHQRKYARINTAFDDMYPSSYAGMDDEDYLLRHTLGEQVLSCLNSGVLDDKERAIIIKYFGLNGDDVPVPAKILAKQYDTTPYRILQAVNEALCKLRKAMGVH